MATAGTVDQLLPLFRDLFPEFSGESDGKVKVYLGLARNIFYKCQDATLYLAAHLLVLANSSNMGLAGSSQDIGENQSSLPMSSIKVDSKSVTFSKFASAKDSQYTTTNYGVIFLQLKKACPSYVFSGGVAGNGC